MSQTYNRTQILRTDLIGWSSFMNGTFAALMLIAGLWDMSQNYCQTNCFQKREVAGYTTYAIGETVFNDDPFGTEVYVRRDTKVAHGPFQNVYGMSISDTGDAWAGIDHAYTIEAPIDRVDVQLHAMTGFYSRGTGIDLGGPIEFRSGIELAYHLENGMRVGLGWDHRSNLEIYARNPGVEMVHLRISIPLE